MIPPAGNAKKLLDFLDGDKRRELENVRAAAERIWARPLHRHYTDHTVAHSERIIALLDGLTAGVMETNKRLSPTEIFVLLAAAYLHDIGMQDERFAGGDPSASSGQRLDEIRAHHNEQTAKMIYDVFKDPEDAFQIPLIDDPSVVEAIALVAQGHRQVDLAGPEYDSLSHGSETLRLRLLAALLRFGDELDIDHRRVDLEQMKLLKLPADSQLHWWKCYYVNGAIIEDECIRVEYRFPKKCPYYLGLIIPLVEKEIHAKLADLKGIFRANKVKVDVAQSSWRRMCPVKALRPEVEELANRQVSPAEQVQVILENWDTDLELETRDPKLVLKHRKLVLNVLSLVAGFASLDMLEYILKQYISPLDSKVLTGLLDELIQWSLVEKHAENESYRLDPAKRDAILENCEQVEDFLIRFADWWCNYVKDKANYTKFSAEYENLLSVLNLLWNRANIRLPEGFDPDARACRSLSPELFVSVNDKPTVVPTVVRQYIEMCDGLTDFFRRTGRWIDYEATAKRAYAAACTFNKRDLALNWAYQLALMLMFKRQYISGDLEIAESWASGIQHAIEAKDGPQSPEDKIWIATAHRLRGVIAMRMRRTGVSARDVYTESLNHFQCALSSLEETDRYDVYAVDIYNLLSKLEMRYNPRGDKRSGYQSSLDYLDEAFASAKQSDQREYLATIQARKVELMVWWGEWDSASLALKGALEMSEKMESRDVRAQILLLKSFVYQHKSVSVSVDDIKRTYFKTALESAEGSREVLEEVESNDHDHFDFDLCGVYSVLAALYRFKKEIWPGAEDDARFKDYFRKARVFLGECKGTYDAIQCSPDVIYEEACLEAMSDNLDEERAYDLLAAVVKAQPGCLIRAEHDFRLNALTKGERQSRWDEFKASVMDRD